MSNLFAIVFVFVFICKLLELSGRRRSRKTKRFSREPFRYVSEKKILSREPFRYASYERDDDDDADADGIVQYSRGRFLSENEKEFLGTLDRVVGWQHRVFAQVRLVDLVSVESDDRSARWKAFNQVAAKSVDFVICNRTSLDPVLILEVDDRSHQRPDRQQRDALVDHVCGQAGLPLLHVTARWFYDEVELLRVLREAGLKTAHSLWLTGN